MTWDAKEGPKNVSETASGSSLAPAVGSVGGRMQRENRGHMASSELSASLMALAMGETVGVHSLQSASEHNGVLGEIVVHNLAKAQWGVKTVTLNWQSDLAQVIKFDACQQSCCCCWAGRGLAGQEEPACAFITAAGCLGFGKDVL